MQTFQANLEAIKAHNEQGHSWTVRVLIWQLATTVPKQRLSRLPPARRWPSISLPT